MTTGNPGRRCFWLLLAFLLPGNGFSQVNAPPDAYEDDSGVAYYGTEDAWNRRAYQKDGADDYKEYGRFAYLRTIGTILPMGIQSGRAAGSISQSAISISLCWTGDSTAPIL